MSRLADRHSHFSFVYGFVWTGRKNKGLSGRCAHSGSVIFSFSDLSSQTGCIIDKWSEGRFTALFWGYAVIHQCGVEGEREFRSLHMMAFTGTLPAP